MLVGGVWERELTKLDLIKLRLGNEAWRSVTGEYIHILNQNTRG
jgi:hypothetical protein